MSAPLPGEPPGYSPHSVSSLGCFLQSSGGSPSSAPSAAPSWYSEKLRNTRQKLLASSLTPSLPPPNVASLAPLCRLLSSLKSLHGSGQEASMLQEMRGQLGDPTTSLATLIPNHQQLSLSLWGSGKGAQRGAAGGQEQWGNKAGRNMWALLVRNGPNVRISGLSGPSGGIQSTSWPWPEVQARGLPLSITASGSTRGGKEPACELSRVHRARWSGQQSDTSWQNSSQ